MVKRIALFLGLLLCGHFTLGQSTVYMTSVYPGYGITGTFVDPVGKGFNGTLSIELARPTAINICTNPPAIVAQQPAIFNVVNGAIVNGTWAQFISNSCLSPSVPYYAQLFDTKHVRVYADNWFFPLSDLGNIDVGTFADVGFQTTTGTQSTATPIVVAIPLAIVSNPAGQQTVTQPNSTSLIINNLTVTGTFSSTAAISASITGNAATATALATSPSQCSSGYYSQGIAANGNANCSNVFPSNSSFGVIQVTGGSSSYASQGLYLNWNIATGVGETDFVNAKGTGAGGFNFYNIADGGTPTLPALVSFDNLGDITIQGSFIGPLTGAVTGNADTATALAATPAQCGAGLFATGIAANGNANCSPFGGTARTCNANGCYQVDSDGTTTQWGNTADLGGSASTFINFPVNFSHACQTIVVSTVSTTDRITYLNATSGSVPCTTGGFTVGSNGSSSSASWIAKGY